MLVSGNLKRISAERYGEGYKISSHKEVKEFRMWKGFAIGLMIAMWTMIVAIVFGCNQAAIDSKQVGQDLTGFTLLGLMTSGWAILPFYYMNASGAAASYFFALLFTVLQIGVSGGFYIAGAYGKRRKSVKEQMLAEKAAAAQEKKEKKINYGGLPGTKPKKRK
jgi:hypothetical protein